MKKLSATLVALGCLFAVAACGQAETFSDEVLADPEGYAYTLAGTFGSHDEDHKAVDWKYTEQGAMEATSIAKVAEVSKDVARALAAKKELVGLYMYKDAAFGWADAAGYDVKAIACELDDMTNTYLSKQWIPDPHTACVQNLTPDTLKVPHWVEEPDENGEAWNQNPRIIAGAGNYTIILAVYDVTVDENDPTKANYAMGAVLTEAKEENGFAHYRLVGAVAEANWDKDCKEAALQFSAEGELTYTFAAENEFQVIRAMKSGSGTWEGQIGASKAALAEGTPAANFDLSGGNIKVLVAGTYLLKVTGELGNETLTIALQ